MSTPKGTRAHAENSSYDDFTEIDVANVLGQLDRASDAESARGATANDDTADPEQRAEPSTPNGEDLAPVAVAPTPRAKRRWPWSRTTPRAPRDATPAGGTRVTFDDLQEPVVFADPIMLSMAPTYSKYLVQQRRGRTWHTVMEATRYGDLPRGKLRLLQMDVYEVKAGVERTVADGRIFVVPAGRYTHYFVRGPIQRSGYRSYSKRLGQQVAFDPNID